MLRLSYKEAFSRLEVSMTIVSSRRSAPLSFLKKSANDQSWHAQQSQADRVSHRSVRGGTASDRIHRSLRANALHCWVLDAPEFLGTRKGLCRPSERETPTKRFGFVGFDAPNAGFIASRNGSPIAIPACLRTMRSRTV